MRFAIVVKKDRQMVRMNRNSFLIAVGNARVWASEGWDVTIVDNENAAAVIEHFASPAHVARR
ncbi:MAG: hypothetical protein QOF22_2133 [Bradyrhizobium sp.]|nr:hypothetical protein [Bradyrhizobium sp.]